MAFTALLALAHSSTTSTHDAALPARSPQGLQLQVRRIGPQLGPHGSQTRLIPRFRARGHSFVNRCSRAQPTRDIRVTPTPDDASRKQNPASQRKRRNMTTPAKCSSKRAKTQRRAEARSQTARTQARACETQGHITAKPHCVTRADRSPSSSCRDANRKRFATG